MAQPGCRRRCWIPRPEPQTHRSRERVPRVLARVRAALRRRGSRATPRQGCSWHLSPETQNPDGNSKVRQGGTHLAPPPRTWGSWGCLSAGAHPPTHAWVRAVGEDRGLWEEGVQTFFHFQPQACRVVPPNSFDFVLRQNSIKNCWGALHKSYKREF